MTEARGASLSVILRDLLAARRRIAGRVARTPLHRSHVLERLTSARVHMKLESVQQTGAFKLRGATNRMLLLSPEEARRGVIAVSSGNHGQAVAYVAGELGMRAVVCVAEQVPATKIEGIRRYGAEARVGGATYEEAWAQAERLQGELGLTFIHPYDDPQVIAGQGTAGLEILEDLPDLDTLVVPLSGGGLIAGVAVAARAADPSIRVIGVMMERGAAMYHSLRAGKLVDVPEEPTLADALAGGLGTENRYSFELCRALVDDVVLVSEEEIARAMRFMLETHHLVVEGGGAVGIAALMHRRAGIGRRVAVIVSGGNVDAARLMEVVRTAGPPP
jgi:threonine dehydratase